MPVPILIKRSSIAGKVPATTDLALGELAVNTVDGRLFLKKNVNGVESVVQVSGSTAASEITGSTLSANVTASSLTSVGTLTSLTVSNTITGSVSGNAATATKLVAARNINGVSFDGSANINFYDTFATGQASPGPRTFPGNSIRGFDAYSSTDFPSSFYSGLTISGPTGVMSSQLAMSWDHVDGQAPGGIYFRVNDDNGDPATWSPWQRIATAADITQSTTNGITTPSITKSGTTGTGDIGQSANKFGTVYATTFSGTATTAQYADLAEMYSADADYEPGTVLVFGGSEEVTVTNRYADAGVAGVVSTAPAYLMNSGLTNGAAVALRGRVPVKVIGQVAKGDLLVASATPGYAVSAGTRVELGAAVFAKALGNKATSDAGIIEAVIL